MDRIWLVTDDGLETEDGSYFIGSDVLSSEMQPGVSKWMLHMTEKKWVEMQEFGDKFKEALIHHGIKDIFNWTLIESLVNDLLLRKHLSEIAEQNISESVGPSVVTVEFSKFSEEVERLKCDAKVCAFAPKVKYT